MEAFDKLPVIEEKLTVMPQPDKFPAFAKVVDKDGKSYITFQSEDDMKRYEKMKEYVLASSEWGKVCNESFNDSQSRSRSIIHLGKATEGYANFLIQRIEDQKEMMEEEKNARFWDNVKSTSLQVVLSIALGIALF
jgi:dsDNA-binding SOS-regulon protein